MPANILRLVCDGQHFVMGVCYDPLEKERAAMLKTLGTMRAAMNPWCCVCGSDLLDIVEEVAAEPTTAAATERLLREHQATRARRDPRWDKARRPRPSEQGMPDAAARLPVRRLRVHMATGEVHRVRGRAVGVQNIGRLWFYVVVPAEEGGVVRKVENDLPVTAFSTTCLVVDEETGEEVFNPRRYHGPRSAVEIAFLIEHPDWPQAAHEGRGVVERGKGFMAIMSGSDASRGAGYAISRDGKRIVCFRCNSASDDPEDVRLKRCRRCGANHEQGLRSPIITGRDITGGQ